MKAVRRARVAESVAVDRGQVQTDRGVGISTSNVVYATDWD